jgi:hypothetical protein
MWLKWLPWKFALRRIARASGFLDPITIMTQLHRFAQPSEVAEPIELLRAGVVFHARGLINSRVIQHNLDWVWPYWVERQFDPLDPSFLPRAFSITHINLSHRNWTAVGLPDCSDLPIVDPRGLVTPHLDGWSLDGWIVTDDGRALLPSRSERATQRVELDRGLAVVTSVEESGLELTTRAEVPEDAATPHCRFALRARADAAGWLIVALRPYNPEGVSFVHDVSLAPDRRSWTIDGRDGVAFDAVADRHHVSDYQRGDVHIHLHDLEDEVKGSCDVGMVTAAALFQLRQGEAREVTASIPLDSASAASAKRRSDWQSSLPGDCRLELPDKHFQRLYEIALRTLVLHAPEDVYPGPYTYKRFWFRDAAFILNAMLCAGLSGRAERVLDQFPARQRHDGYFHSQAGEWDSNGEALWIMHRFCQLTGSGPKQAWHQAIRRGARWIERKRLSDLPASPHSGLLPAGFSAEHLGPNDYYYWDDFWGVAGLRAAARMSRMLGKDGDAERQSRTAEAFAQAIDRSLAAAAARMHRPAMPASPYRRLDSGAIGSIVVGYPLQLWEPRDPRLMDTTEFLLSRCMIKGAFYQDMVHSGINAYLTLHLAQVLLRAGDRRWYDLAWAVAQLASPTGQWPEAIHPHTGGGCMGDGQHVWAAAEWVMMLRNCFVREEEGRLILASGLISDWLRPGASLRFGPAPTAYGSVSISVECSEREIQVSWQGDWPDGAPAIEVRLPGRPAVSCAADQTSLTLALEPAP